MNRIGIYCAGLAAIAVLGSAPANAQAIRTWVSGVGDDANPCSRTAPCKTFAGAIGKTAAGGEINCLDPGGYGGVSITKSITIDCRGTNGSALVANSNGFVVNGENIVVNLRGLSINGSGNGMSGIRFINGRSLQVTDVTIAGFAAATSNGILIANGGSANIHLENVRISGSRDGVGVRPTGTATVTLVNSSLTGNVGAGLAAEGAGARVRVGNTTLSGNGVGVQAGNGATILSYGDNRLDGNGSDGAFTGPASPRR